MTTALVRRGHTPTRHVYDVILVGSHLAGAMCAALMARRGLHVLVIPHDALAQPYLDGGFLLPHRPFLMPGTRAVGAFEDVLTELGLTAQVHRALSHPPLQLLSPGSWFELRWAEGPRAKELTRALGERAGAFDDAFLQASGTNRLTERFFSTRPELLPEGPLASWQARRALRQATGLTERSPLPGESALRALLPFAASLATPSPITETRALAFLLQGAAQYPGGAEGLAGTFFTRAQELGADVVDVDTFVRSLSFEGGGVALRLSSGETAFRAPVMVGAMDLELIATLMPEARRGPLKKAFGRLRPAAAMFTVNVVLPEHALPPGLGPVAIVFPPPRRPAVYVEQSPAPGHPGMRTLTLGTVAPYPVKPVNEAAVRALVDATWDAVGDVLPFTRAHAVRESTPWLHSQAVVDRQAEPWPLFEPGPQASLGIEGHPTGGLMRALVLASRQVLPGLGLEGDVLAATRAAARVEKLVKRSDPLKARKSA